MKKLLYLIVIAAFAASCSNEPKYIVSGNIEGVDTGVVIIQKRVSGAMKILDSAVIKNGAFKMDGSIDYPQLVTMTVKNSRSGLSFFLENSKINITGNIDSLYKSTITGSATESEFEAFQATFDDLSSKFRDLDKRYSEAEGAGNEELMASLEKEADALYSEYESKRMDYVKNNPSSFVTPVILSEIAPSLEVADLENMLSSLDTALNRVDIITRLKDRVAAMKVVAIGQKAPDFTLNDVDGNPVSLYSKIGGKNKLLLVDFWASWCGPCRRENPKVVATWKQFNKNGFDVFGVSLDNNGDDWKKAIQDDQLTWTHVSDLKYWNSEAAKLYAVNSIPANFLLDENGIIIDHNLRGDALAAKVEELLGKK